MLSHPEPKTNDIPAPCRAALLTLALALLLAAAFQALVPAQTAARREKSSPEVSAEVVGGQSVSQGTFRFMTFMVVSSPDGAFICGGSLIAPRFVLTAAHCVEDRSGDLIAPEDFSLTIGRANLSDRGQGVTRAVAAVFQHPDWDPTKTGNEFDIAVLELTQAVPPHIARPLPFVESGETRFDAAGQLVAVAGWGVTSGGSSTNQLQAADLAIVGANACANAYGDEFVAAVMVCAAFKGRDSCQGDSGGPLFAREIIGYDITKTKKKKGKKRRTFRTPIYRDTQMGIVSFGIGCALPAFPGVYTRLSNDDVNGFILEVVGEIHG